MAKLKAVIPSLDAVPEAVREFYVPIQGGGFALDTDDMDAVRQTVAAQEAAMAVRVAEAEARKALEQAGADIELMVPHTVKHLLVERVGTEFSVRVVDEKGEPRVKDERGTPMGVDDLVRELKADRVYGRGFRGNGSSGSGMRPSGPPLSAPSTVLRLTRAQASDAVVYRAAKARAEREALRLEIEPE